MQLPRDLIDEIEAELDSWARQATIDSGRARALLELRAEAGVAAAQLGRPLTVFDYLDRAPDCDARARRKSQLRQLRRARRTAR